jgi:hypothetical protein
MGNLLAHVDSFDWREFDLNRNNSVLKFDLAIQLANDQEDNLYYHPIFFEDHQPSCDLFMYLWSSSYDDFKEIFPWIKEPIYQMLIQLKNYLKPTPNGAKNFIELIRETSINNNSFLGLDLINVSPLVCCEDSWNEFHKSYVTNFSREERITYRDYFIKFYNPELKVSAEQIQQLIYRNQEANCFVRIDTPSTDANGNILHGEQVHMHFNDNDDSALNLDGTWKHGKCDIPEAASNRLVEWGFVLPENIV